VILAAEPDSTIALGTKAPTDRETLRAAALDGSIEDLLDWKPVKAGDFFYSLGHDPRDRRRDHAGRGPAEQRDLTYRLYDYGSPRELHLDDGIAVSDPVPFVPHPMPGKVADDRTILAEGPKFVLERWEGGTARSPCPRASPAGSSRSRAKAWPTASRSARANA
jgi:mannose-6-phosphate isomerase